MFGLVSLFADMVYEGMRSIAGPYLGQLGASAATVGIITGAGEGVALILRLVAGTVADRTHRHWTLTITGYPLTAVCVPLLALAPAADGAGLAAATILILAERTGKALRSPSKSVLLAFASQSIGRGKGFGVHKALDQVGAFSGPLLVAALATVSSIRVGLAALAVPGVIAIVLLLVLRRRLDTGNAGHRANDATRAADPGKGTAVARPRLPLQFHTYAAAVGLTTAGLFTFGVLAYHLADARLVATSLVPVVYAAAMAVGALAALAAGQAFDRYGGRTLLGLPPLVAAVPALAFADNLSLVLTGIGLWGAATGVQDSTVKALVADLVPRQALGTAYGVFAAYQGVAALVGGAMAGMLYSGHRTALTLGTVAAMLIAYLPLSRAVQRPRHPPDQSPA